MKFSINKDLFIEQLSKVTRAISNKATISILKGIKLTVTKNGITLIGSDSDISIKTYLDTTELEDQLRIDEPGSIVIKADLFYDIIRKLPEEKINFSTDENSLQLTIQSGSSIFNILGREGSEYPHLPEYESLESIDLPTKSFKQLISNTIFSASNQENRPYLTGLQLRFENNQMIGVATDSRRLSRQVIPLELDEKKLTEQSLILPKKTATEINRIVKDTDILKLVIDNQQVIFSFDNTIIYSRLLEGNYPDADRLIPQEASTEIVVDANLLYDALDRASLLSIHGDSNVVTLGIEKDELTLMVLGYQQGKVNETIETKSISGEDLLISFNPSFMKEALRSFGDVFVKISFQSVMSPMLLSAESPSTEENDGLLQLLTPIRTHYTP